ncbi:MAG: YraN family protein [Spirochaetota bacterium]
MSCSFGPRETGKSGEESAAAFFSGQGFSIVDKNFRFGTHGEIDLILRKGDLFVFAEVKARRGDAFGGAIYSISGAKKSRMKKTAGHYIRTHLSWCGPECTFRFDLLSVSEQGCEWIQDIIR